MIPYSTPKTATPPVAVGMPRQDWAKLGTVFLAPPYCMVSGLHIDRIKEDPGVPLLKSDIQQVERGIPPQKRDREISQKNDVRHKRMTVYFGQ
jgi:hypothetical protein